MSIQQLERIKLDIHNNLSYEETDLLQDYIETIQTPEWKIRRENKEDNLSDEEIKIKNDEQDRIQLLKEEMDEEPQEQEIENTDEVYN